MTTIGNGGSPFTASYRNPRRTAASDSNSTATGQELRPFIGTLYGTEDGASSVPPRIESVHAPANRGRVTGGHHEAPRYRGASPAGAQLERPSDARVQ